MRRTLGKPQIMTDSDREAAKEKAEEEARKREITEEHVQAQQFAEDFINFCAVLMGHNHIAELTSDQYITLFKMFREETRGG